MCFNNKVLVLSDVIFNCHFTAIFVSCYIFFQDYETSTVQLDLLIGQSNTR